LVGLVLSPHPHLMLWVPFCKLNVCELWMQALFQNPSFVCVWDCYFVLCFFLFSSSLSTFLLCFEVCYFFYFPLSYILLLPPYFICSMCKISTLKISSWPCFSTTLKSSFKKSNNNKKNWKCIWTWWSLMYFENVFIWFFLLKLFYFFNTIF
jgi:hypothetical protein